MTPNNLKIIQFVGALLTLIGAALKLFEFDFANYIFAVGALILIVLQIFFVIQSRKTEDKRTQRLNRLMFLATAMLGLAAYLMFTDKNSWVVMVLTYAILSVFLSFRSK